MPEDSPMKRLASLVSAALAAVCLGAPVSAQDAGLAKPSLVLKQRLDGMPKGDVQEVSVLTASFAPGDRTVFHTHRFPVTVYVLEGAFTLELEGRPAVVVKVGEAYVEPPNVRMTGYNRSAVEPLRLLIVYVSDPGGPFLDAQHH